MKILCILIFILLSMDGFSQTSFKMQIDTSIKIAHHQTLIVSCVDGGIAIAAVEQKNGIFNTLLYKCDSIGNYEWSNYYNMDMNDIDWSGTLQIKATNDSGFYLLSHARHDGLGWFDTPTLQKINKNGIITSAISMTDNSAGNSLYLSAVEKYNNNLFGFGISSEYDGGNDVTCCFDSYSFKLDSTLGLRRKISYNWLLYDTLDVPFGVIPKYDTNYVWKGFELYDTSGYQFSTIKYSFDSNQVDKINPLTFCQDNNNYYFLERLIKNTLDRACIHKVDKNFNTIFSVVIDTANNIPPLYRWGPIAMDKSSEGNLLISSIFWQSANKSIPFILEMDTSGNIIHAWKGDGTDSLYFTTSIDTISGSIFFGSSNEASWVSPFKIERQLPSSPSCGFTPVIVSTFPLSNIVDSIFVANDTLIEGVYPICFSSLVPEVNLPILAATPICGVLSGNQETSPEGGCIPTIYPNPANDKIKISFQCNISQIAEVKIFNIMGEEVFSKSISTSNYETIFDVSELPAGIYLVKSQSADQAVFNSKIVIQK